MKLGTKLLIAGFAVAALAASRPVAAQDILALGTATGDKGTTVTIPLYVRDASGTILGLDAGAGNLIQGINLQLTWAAGLGTVSSIVHSGICGPLTPIAEFAPGGGPTSIGYVVSYSETTNQIPFTLDAASPGQQVATVSFAISASAPKGTFPITINPSTLQTQLVNQAGTLQEDTGLAPPNTLSVLDGSVTITPVELTGFHAD
jgi:hypothetical protein